MVRKLANLEKVAGHTGHNLSRLVVIVEGEGELLQVRKEVAAHRRLHLNTYKVTVILDEVAQEHTNDVEDKNEKSDGDYGGIHSPRNILV